MKTNKIRTIFIGTPDFAVPSFEALLADDDFEILGVVTQPDKKVGRKQKVLYPPVKSVAVKNNIAVWQPDKISGFRFPVSGIDLIVVVAYAQIIPEAILNLPQYGCVNVHGSILPKYRGAACIQAAIANGDKETGITIMKMEKSLDTGPIIFQSKIDIEANDTAGTMFDKLAGLGARILPGILKKYISGELSPVPQDDSKASYVGMLKKEDGKIDWSKKAESIELFIRSRQPWPSSWSNIDGKILKITGVETSPVVENKYRLGELFLHGGELAVQCGNNALIIKKLQLEGKKESLVADFLNGHRDFIGKVLS